MVLIAYPILILLQVLFLRKWEIFKPPLLVEGVSPKYLLTGRIKEGSRKQRGLQ